MKAQVDLHYAYELTDAGSTTPVRSVPYASLCQLPPANRYNHPVHIYGLGNPALGDRSEEKLKEK